MCIRDSFNTLKEKEEAIFTKKLAGQKRLLKAFPDMKSVRYKESLEQLKEKIKAHSK